ncbi:hypothetical protein V2S66_10465 [Streptomyces sp. V4-01]|uniref:Uncharacterized protein n=1 Tax=Actinacidiphila polyblastidii TaxID=3110430 RepID=A0ABU7P9P6_9ACTN|nr:hypothetical protein [Streptomyces sp. V4-01]
MSTVTSAWRPPGHWWVTCRAAVQPGAEGVVVGVVAVVGGGVVGGGVVGGGVVVAPPSVVYAAAVYAAEQVDAQDAGSEKS